MQLLQVIKKKIRDSPQGIDYVEEVIPYYRNFDGTIEYTENNKYATKGVYSIQKQKVIVTELPIGVWNEDYICFLEKCLETKKNKLKDYKDLSTDKTIHIELIFNNDVELDKYSTINMIEKNFKLQSTVSISNMYLFNAKEKLVHYKSVNHILNDFIETRLEYYDIRKNHLVKKMEHDMMVLSNKYRYIAEILNDTIDLRKKKSTQIEQMLLSKEYNKIENSYNYLIKMPMDSVNEENIEKLKSLYEKTAQELDVLKSTPCIDTYYKELCELEKVL